MSSARVVVWAIKSLMSQVVGDTLKSHSILNPGRDLSMGFKFSCKNVALKTENGY